MSQGFDMFDTVDTFDDSLSYSFAQTSHTSYGEDWEAKPEENRYCTPRSQFTVESIQPSTEFGFVAPAQNIWAAGYRNDMPLDRLDRSRSSSMSSPQLIPMVATNPLVDYSLVGGTNGNSGAIYATGATSGNATSAGVGTGLGGSGAKIWFKSYTGNKITVNPKCRFFVIKSYNIIDVNASFINGIWASTELGNKRLSKAFKSTKTNGGDIYLFFLVNGSGKFSGICRMTSDVDFNKSSDIWSEVSKWQGIFQLEWLLIKDIPNKYFQNLKVPQNENKPVTNSRDTQEVPFDVAISMLKIFNTFKTSNSFLMQ